MNYPRIVKFALLLYVFGVSISTMLTIGFGENLESEISTFVNLNYAIGFVITLFGCALLGFKQTEKPYKHSILVVICLWFMAVPVDFLINLHYGIPFNPLIYIFPFVLDAFGISIGTMIGIKIRERRVTNAS